MKNLRFSVVQIRSSNRQFLGTGFFISHNQVLTCQHVVSTEKNILVSWLGDTRNVIATTPHQLCDAISLDLSSPFPINPEIIPWAYYTPSEDRKVLIVGFQDPDNYNMESLTRYVRGYAGKYDLCILDHPVIKGFSGSPALINNNIVGMVMASDVNRTFLIPSIRLKE